MIERDGPDDTFGWGIVFSDQTFDYLRDSDAPSFEAITAACEQWDNVDIVHRGERITVRGNRFSGIARIRVPASPAGIAAASSASICSSTSRSTISTALPPHDLLVGADGANSLVRRHVTQSVSSRRVALRAATSTSGWARRGCSTA